ncbi:hypothetical protein JCM19992_09320 [Thermostilla marina]
MRAVIGQPRFHLHRNIVPFAAAVCCFVFSLDTARAEEAVLVRRVPLRPEMIVNEASVGTPQGMVDEQENLGDPPSSSPESAWNIPSQYWKNFPYAAQIRLGETHRLASLWLYDTFGKGTVRIEAGEPGTWREVATIETDRFHQWKEIPMDVEASALRIVRLDPGSQFAEIALYEYTDEGYRRLLAQKKAEAERRAALQRAAEEAKHRPLIDLGEPFGALPLVDEVDLAADDPGHRFQESPNGASHVETILGRRCRVLKPVSDESSYFAVRLGEMKLLKPGATYVVVLEYPEDKPRSWLVLNGGCETSTGFHTGNTTGDALHPRYVNNNSESLNFPLSGQYKQWTMVFQLHDRFPALGFPRGEGPRPLIPEDGFTLVIGHFSAPNDPTSAGAAVARIRLFEVPDPQKLACPLRLPPPELPHRHISWREEMADGVIQSDDETRRGLRDPLDWYRHKAFRMKFLGINTYTKDLLEFGACQHWDSTPYGGNDWVYFNYRHKDLWERIVGLMGGEGFEIVPYYEYSGSKGKHGLGNQRRAKPLTRDDAFTHVSWVESANADITDPDTYADFQKMLDATIVRFADKAPFAGIWLRSRAQLPIGFGDATRARFAAEANDGKQVSREDLRNDPQLLARYYDWWYGKRREFLAAMRDYLAEKGVCDAPIVLFTSLLAESGASFPTWEKRIVVDDVTTWTKLSADPAVNLGKEIVPVSIERVVREDLYLDALLSPPLDWGGWEVGHANPPPDPQRYRDTPGVLMTHCIGRYYMSASPKTFETFRGPSGLAVVRHYPLNEDMMFDAEGKSKLDYVVADIEYAGPYCMMPEAMAVANGDPTYLAYLTGSNYNRGFPQYVRRFNAAFLALPALPSRPLHDTGAPAGIVVREIATPKHGTYYAVVNTTYRPQETAITLPAAGQVLDAASGREIAAAADNVPLRLDPFELRALYVPPAE